MWNPGDRTRGFVLGALVSTIAFGLPQPAAPQAKFSQREPAFQTCGTNDATEAERLAACNLFLQLESEFTAERQSRLLNMRASLRASIGDGNGAAEDLTEAIHLLPKDASTLEARADLLRAGGQCELAILDYHQAATNDSGNLAIRLSHAECLIELGELEGAGALLDPVVDADSDNAKGLAFPALKLKARAAIASKEMQEAVSHLTKALVLKPDDTQTLIERGWLWSNLKKDEFAAADFDRAIEVSRVDAVANATSRIAKGDFLVQSGAVEAAKAEFDAVMAASPGHVAGLVHRAYLNVRMDKLDEAVADFSKVIDAQPSNADALVGRASAFHYAAKFEKSGRDWRSAYSVSGSPSLLIIASVSNARAGSKDALPEMQRATATFDRNTWPYPVIQLFAGARTPTSMVGAAKSPSETCEAHFYAAQWHILRGERQAGKEAAGKAASLCPDDRFERRAALEELKRLK